MPVIGMRLATTAMFTQAWNASHTVMPVDHTDELAMGIASEPAKAIGSVDQWRQQWLRADQAYAMMPPGEYDKLKIDGVPMRELGRDPRRVIVSRR